MLAILLWKLNPTSFKGRVLSNNKEKALFNKKFLELGQARRLKILKAFGYITNSQYKDLDDIRDKRNDYMHDWHISNTNKKKDAIEILMKALKIYKEIMDIKIGGPGHVKIGNPKLIDFLAQNE